MLPFNTSAFLNLLGASDCAAQCKAIVTSFEEFDAKSEDVLQHIACFTQCCEETGPPPSDFNMTDPIEKAAWLRSILKKILSLPDPKTMPLASKQLVSFQNRQWIYVLLMSVWSAAMKTIMLHYQELHDKDGVVLW
jgi:hypothetical protein